MKLRIILLLAVLLLPACSSTSAVRKNNPGAIPTSDQYVEPPQGCIELRKRGGSC